MGSGLSNWRGLGSGGWLLYKLVQDQLRKRPVMCVYLFYQWLLISIRQRGGTGYYCLCFLHECWLCVYWKRLCLLVISGWLATWACVCTCVCILVPMRNVYSSDSLGQSYGWKTTTPGIRLPLTVLGLCSLTRRRGKSGFEGGS